MDKCGNFVTLSDETQFGVFNLLSDLVYSISELECRGKTHLSHLKNIRKDITLKFKATRNVKRIRSRPGVYESLITNIDLIDFLEASERTELEYHFLQFSGRGSFSIPRIPPPTEITTEYIRLWNEFFTYRNTHRPRRGKRKKSDFDNFNLFISDNHSFLSNLPESLLITKPIELIDNQFPRFNKIYNLLYPEPDSNNRIVFDLITNRISLLEWTTTCGFVFNEVKDLQDRSIDEPDPLVGEELVRHFTIQRFPWKPPIQVVYSDIEDRDDLVLDIPVIEFITNKLPTTKIINLRRYRFGSNRLATNYAVKPTHDTFIQIDDLLTAVDKKRKFFNKKMTLYFGILEGVHYVHKHLINALPNISNYKNKNIAELALSSISILEDQYRIVFKENILIKPTKYIDNRRMKTKKKLLNLASMVIATPPCDSELLTTIHYELGGFTPFLRKSKISKQLTSVIELPQKSLVKRSSGFIYKAEEEPTAIEVVFPTWIELAALDLPSEIFSQHKLRIGDSLLYNSDMILGQLLDYSSAMTFTIQ